MSTTPVLSKTVAAYFSTESAAQKALDDLRDAGFTANQIGIATRSSGTDVNYRTTAGHTAGAKTESAWDKVKNFFAGTGEAEPYADEHRRGDLASHEITTGDDYSTADFRDSLAGLSVPQDRSRYFGHRFSQGDQGAVVTVNAPGREAEAERILAEDGGDLGGDATGYDYSEETAPSGDQRIQLLGEVLRVHKDRIGRGEIRIRKEVITETQTVEVPVIREELVIERTAPTDVHSATGSVGEGSEIRIPLTEEVVSVDKDTVVREEVTVGKRAVQNVANVGDNVSREELVVEDSTTTPGATRRTA